jgi:hypothetical protein
MMIKKRPIYIIAAWLVASIVVYGVVLPMMISAKSNEIVVGGFSIMIGYTILLIVQVVNFINEQIKKTKDEEDD